MKFYFRKKILFIDRQQSYEVWELFVDENKQHDRYIKLKKRNKLYKTRYFIFKNKKNKYCFWKYGFSITQKNKNSCFIECETLKEIKEILLKAYKEHYLI